jgi:hypothetical protein
LLTRYLNLETSIVRIPKRCQAEIRLFECDSGVGLYVSNQHIGTAEKSSPQKSKVK